MYREWTNPACDMEDMAKFRAYVKDLHDNILDGTTLTHLSDIEGQFDFENESISYNDELSDESESKPLYYEYKNAGKQTLIIKFIFYYTRYGNYSSATPEMFSRVGVFLTKEDALRNSYYRQPPSINRSSMKLTKSVRREYTAFTPSTGKSYIIDNNGSLMICSHLGFITGNNYHYTNALLFLYVEATETGFKSFRHYNEGYIYDTRYYSNGSENIDKTYFRVTTFVVNNNVTNEMYTYSTNQLLDDKCTTLNKVVTYDRDSNIVAFDNLYFYNRKAIGGHGFIDIQGKKVFLSGDQLREYNINSDKMSFAVLAE